MLRGLDCRSRSFLCWNRLHHRFASLCTDKVEIQIIQNTLHLGGVLGKHDELYFARVELVADWNIEQAMVSCFPRKIPDGLFGNLEEFERALFFEHAHQPRLSACFLLILEHRVGEQCEILRRQSGQLEGHLCPFQRKADYLIRRTISVIQLFSSLQRSKPAERFFCFSGAGILENLSLPGIRDKDDPVSHATPSCPRSSIY